MAEFTVPPAMVEAAARSRCQRECGPFGVTWDDAGEDYRVKVLAEAVDDLTAALSACGDEHVYLSTSCLHAVEPGREDLHDECKTNERRYDGSHKYPAECKHCAAPCICPCHKEASDG